MWFTNLFLSLVLTVLSVFGGGTGPTAPRRPARAIRKGHIAAEQRWAREPCTTTSGEIVYGPCGAEMFELSRPRNR
jgi:hypothetical protein